MQLLRITVKNYRSIEAESFEVKPINDSYTYSFIGVNESGKTSFLKAVSFIDDGNAVAYPQDFHDDTKKIEVSLAYKPELEDIKKLKEELTEKGFDRNLLSQIEVIEFEVFALFDPKPDTIRYTYDLITFKKDTFEDYSLKENGPVKKENAEEPDFNLSVYFENQLKNYFWRNCHMTIFWRSEPKYLINEPINLDTFATDPDTTSVPLKNCFELAGITDIKVEIDKIRENPAETNNLQERLNDKITTHIKKVWPNHPIKIKFQITNMHLSFLIEDEGVKYKSKTVAQRSDGFRQFVSFLLTVSAESNSGQLSHTILLLDEPETHLHPQAQEYLMEELIKITKNKEDNVVIYATHSNYMIDKTNLGRNYRVIKGRSGKTRLEQIQGTVSSYSEVNYEVFGIATNDYHNELYGYLEDINPAALKGLTKTKKWQNKKSGNSDDVSTSEYIRHSIHHPENTLNDKYSYEELSSSIESLRGLKYAK